MNFTVVSSSAINGFLDYILNAIGVTVGVSISLFGVIFGLYLIVRVVKMFIH